MGWNGGMTLLLFILLEENEVRTMVDPNSKNDRKLQELMKVGVDSPFGKFKVVL